MNLINKSNKSTHLGLYMEEINELYNEITGLDRWLTEFYWEWRETWNGEGSVYLLYADGILICHYGLIPVPFSFFGKPVLAGKTENCMCRSEFRGTGLYYKHEKSNFEDAKKRFEMFFTTAGYMGQVKTIREKLGYTKLDNWVTYYHINLFKHTSNPVKLYYSVEPWSNVDSLTRFQQIEKLWEKNKKRYGVSVDRKVEYLQWRIDNNPYKKYKYFAAYYPYDCLVGYVIFYLYKKHHIKIEDILADYGNKEEIFKLLLQALKLYPGARLISCSTLKSNIILKEAFKQNKYFSRQRKNNSFYVYMPKWARTEPHQWYITDLVKEGR